MIRDSISVNESRFTARRFTGNSTTHTRDDDDDDDDDKNNAAASPRLLQEWE